MFSVLLFPAGPELGARPDGGVEVVGSGYRLGLLHIRTSCASSEDVWLALSRFELRMISIGGGRRLRLLPVLAFWPMRSDILLLPVTARSRKPRVRLSAGMGFRALLALV